MTWYVAMVAPQCELKVRDQTIDRGFGAYVPQMRGFKPKDPLSVVTKPLMGGYVFVDLDDVAPRFDLFQPDSLVTAQIGPLQPVQHCRGFVLWAGSPGPVAASVIDDLKAREARGEFDLTELTENGRHVIPKWIKIGRAVEFVAGPFKGRIAYICKTISDKIVGVTFGFLGQDTKINVPIEYIASAR